MTAKATKAAKPKRLTRAQQLATAYHEAGHAVAAAHMNMLGQEGATINSTADDDFMGYASLEKPRFKGRIDDMGDDALWVKNLEYNRRIFERWAVVMIAGYMAQRRFNPLSLRNHHDKTDWRQVLDMIGCFGNGDEGADDAYLRRLETRAKKLVNELWVCIEAVAMSLVERKQISKDRIIVITQAGKLLRKNARLKQA